MNPSTDPPRAGAESGSATAAGESAAPGPPGLIRAERLSIAYGRTRVLTDVTLTVRAGECWFLLGGNGQGKTSFLRAVLGLLVPAVGGLWLHPTLAARARIGFVPQRCDLNPSLPTTVREFVGLGLVGIPVAKAESSERLERSLKQVGLADFRCKNYWALSGGQRQRALVARALIREPPLLVLDEPTNGLDPASEEALLELIATLHRQEGRTVLFVTHDVAVAQRLATHVALFHGGGVVAGAREEVLTPASLSRVFGFAAARPGGERYSVGGHD